MYNRKFMARIYYDDAFFKEALQTYNIQVIVYDFENITIRKWIK